MKKVFSPAKQKEQYQCSYKCQQRIRFIMITLQPEPGRDRKNKGARHCRKTLYNVRKQRIFTKADFPKQGQDQVIDHKTG